MQYLIAYFTTLMLLVLLESPIALKIIIIIQEESCKLTFLSDQKHTFLFYCSLNYMNW